MSRSNLNIAYIYQLFVLSDVKKDTIRKIALNEISAPQDISEKITNCIYNPKITNAAGETILHWFARLGLGKNHPTLARNFIDLVLATNSDVLYIKNAQGYTPLATAALANDYLTADILRNYY